MFQFFSSSENTGGFGGGPSSMRGTTPGVVGGQPVSSGLFGGLGAGQARGRSSSVLQGSITAEPLLESGYTDEPPSLTDTSGSSGRGRCAPTEAGLPPPHNGAQALACRLGGLEAIETSKSGVHLELTSTTRVQEARNIPSPLDPSYEEVGKWKPARGFSRRYFLGISSVTTPDDRFPRYPLRVGTHPPLFSESATNGGCPRPIRMLTIHGGGVESFGESKVPLKSTLCNGSSGISSTLPTPSTTSTLLILAIGVNDGKVKDPKHDIDLLTTLFGGHDPEKIQFRGISGEEATLEVVEEAIGELYREALKSPDPNMLILFTGEGDDNRMCLSGGEFITDKDLRRWIWRLQIDCHPNIRTVTIILDYCRTNPDIPIGTHVGIEFIGSCSPGQKAAGLKLAQDIPRSCFLLALMKTSHRFSQNRGELAGAVNDEMCQLLRFLGRIGEVRHESGRCDDCNKGKPCETRYYPQNPDWRQAGNMRSIYDFVDRLSKMDVVAKVHDLLTGHKYFCEANGLPADRGVFEPRALHQNGVAQHNRGSSKPVHAAPKIQMESQQTREDGAGSAI